MNTDPNSGSNPVTIDWPSLGLYLLAIVAIVAVLVFTIRAVRKRR